MRFEVFKDGKPVKDFSLCGAYIFGNDGIAIRGAKIEFKKGFVECRKANMETAGLALLWPIEGFGRAELPTTCLPERARPYNLNLELARAKLMQIITKCEDWSFFDSAEGLNGIGREAEDLFIQAVQNISDPPRASKLADESLRRAIVFSEELATKQADICFSTRCEVHGFGKGCLGCRMDVEQSKKPEYISKLLELFSFVMIPVNWGRIEVERGCYDFSEVDACINALVKKRVSVGAGPLLCFSEEYLPKWLMKGRGGFEKIREAGYQFVSNVVERYSGSIRTWHVISGLNAFNHFSFNFEQVLEMTRAATMAVKATGDRATKIIEISNPWGEYYATKAQTIPPLVYMDMLIQSGINFDAFGFQMRFGRDESGMHVRDVMHISAMLEQAAPVGKPLYITDVEVPSRMPDSPESELAGVWHERWNESGQAKWLEQFYKTAFSKPFVESVIYSHLADVEGSIISDSGLLNEQLESKESFHTLKKIRELIFGR